MVRGGRRERGARPGPGGPRRLPLHAVVGACGSGAQTTVPEAARLRPPCAGLAHSRMQSKKVSRASPNSYFWQKEKTKEKRKFVSRLKATGVRRYGVRLPLRPGVEQPLPPPPSAQSIAAALGAPVQPQPPGQAQSVRSIMGGCSLSSSRRRAPASSSRQAPPTAPRSSV